jgi:hypothetical protein
VRLSGGGNAPDRLAGFLGLLAVGGAREAMRRIVEIAPFNFVCFLTGETLRRLRADGRGVHLLGIWGKRKREGRSIDDALPHTCTEN